jgi:hypothetical protein
MVAFSIEYFLGFKNWYTDDPKNCMTLFNKYSQIFTFTQGMNTWQKHLLGHSLSILEDRVQATVPYLS